MRDCNCVSDCEQQSCSFLRPHYRSETCRLSNSKTHCLYSQKRGEVVPFLSPINLAHLHVKFFKICFSTSYLGYLFFQFISFLLIFIQNACMNPSSLPFMLNILNHTQHLAIVSEPRLCSITIFEE